MRKLEILVKSVYAGFMIGIGGIVYLSLENKVIGSLFFSFEIGRASCRERVSA